jgi:hypothetical protein
MVSGQVKDSEIFLNATEPLPEEFWAEKGPFHFSGPFVHDRQLFAVVTDASIKLGDRAAVFQAFDDDSPSFGACMIWDVGAGALAVVFVAEIVGMRVI